MTSLFALALLAVVLILTVVKSQGSKIENRGRYLWATIAPQEPRKAYEAWVPLTDLARIFHESNVRSEWYQDTDKVLYSPPHPHLGKPIEVFYVHKVTTERNKLGLAEVFENGMRVWADDDVHMSAKTPDDLEVFFIGGHRFERLPIKTAKEAGKRR